MGARYRGRERASCPESGPPRAPYLGVLTLSGRHQSPRGCYRRGSRRISVTEAAGDGGWPNGGATAPTVERGPDDVADGGAANDLAGAEAAARYSAWADRMRAKRRRDQDH